MQAIILAAGLGTRLKPLTDNIPKALVRCAGKPLIDHAIDYLVRQGIDYILVNVHHHGDVLKEYIEGKQYPVPVVISDETAELKDTGGALVHALPLMKEERSILIFNTDILTDLSLASLYQDHNHSDRRATLIVQNRDSSRKLAFSEDNLLTGWMNCKTGESIGSVNEDSRMWAFSGIHLIDLELIKHFQKNNGNRPFPIIPAYLEASQHLQIGSYTTPEGTVWLETGSPERLKAAELALQQKGKNRIL